MTEKRFDVVYEEDDEYKNIRYWEIKDKKCGATTSNELEICHLLNNLNDENEQLKSQIEHLKVKMDRERNATTKQHIKWDKEVQEKINELQKENKELRSDRDYWKTLAQSLAKNNGKR